ncbi:hypothetical protein BBJ28_00015355 [Nothophytophthora sp. Chile5]|nr:hypothetical protein BBJ28_00015355 [Nothophytophthora sp. Chile5]
MHEGLYTSLYRDVYDDAILDSGNINLIHKRVDAVGFGKIIAESAFFLCPSSQEGYGHYIDQARASGGVIITTDVHPMNELISSSKMGVLIPSKRTTHPDMLLGGGFKGPNGLKSGEGLVASFTAYDICSSVQYVLEHVSVERREEMGANARRQYHEDTKFFAQRMIQLRLYARQVRNLWVPPEADIAVGDPERMNLLRSELES